MGHDPQLYLRIVRGNNFVSPGRNKGLANTPALLGPDGNILQVGVGGREAASCGYCLVIGGMHPPGSGIYHLRKLIGVGRFQFTQGSIFQQQFWQGVIQG